MFNINNYALRRAVEEKNISARELARLAKLSPSTVIELLSSKRDEIYLKTARKLAKALGFQTKELYKPHNTRQLRKLFEEDDIEF